MSASSFVRSPVIIDHVEGRLAVYGGAYLALCVHLCGLQLRIPIRTADALAIEESALLQKLKCVCVCVCCVRMRLW